MTANGAPSDVDMMALNNIPSGGETLDAADVMQQEYSHFVPLLMPQWGVGPFGVFFCIQ